jgi:hypothetical protein
MRENRSYGSEGGEPQVNAAFLPLSECLGVRLPRNGESAVTIVTYETRRLERIRTIKATCTYKAGNKCLQLLRLAHVFEPA